MTDFQNEAFHVDQFCRGLIEYKLPDKSIVDCLEPSVAWEYDWDNKWAECIGQALNYAVQTNKKAGCVLITKDRSKLERYVYRFKQATMYVDVQLVVIDAISK